MPLFSTGDLTRFFNNGEQELAIEQPFLVDRLSVAITAETAVYTLPDYVLSIKRITWLGMKLDPLPRRNQRDVFQNANQVGRPFWYIYNNIGANLIQFFPNPGINVAAGTHLWSTDIPTSVIVEFWRQTDNSTFVVPPYFRNQLLKRYTAYKARMLDGPGINMKMSKYFSDQWGYWKGAYFELLSDLYSKPRKYCVNEIVSSNYFPAAPVLPIGQFGIGVDEGY